jgi:hypothetical protein
VCEIIIFLNLNNPRNLKFVEMMTEQQPQQAVENNKRRSSSMLDDSNSNESSGSLNSRSGSSAGSCRSHSSSVDIETNGSADEGPQQRRSHVDMVAALSTVASVNPPLTVADSLSPAKPALLAVPAQHQHEVPATSTGNKLSLNHHVSHLYTIEAILGLNNQHPKGKFKFYF